MTINMTNNTTQITFSPSKIEIVKRLLEAKNITFEESLLLMDRIEIGFKELTPPIQPYQPFPYPHYIPPVTYGPGLHGENVVGNDCVDNKTIRDNFQ